MPTHGRPARSTSAVAVNIDADVIVVRSPQALREMEAHLFSGGRVHPVVGITRLAEANLPVLAPEQVRAIVGGGPRIYYLPGGYLQRRLQGVLGRALALPAGGVRVWWPPLGTRSDPEAHPFVLALDSESQAQMLAEFARRFDLSRPLVRCELALIEDIRALAEYDLSQARKQSRSLEVERDEALTRALEAEHALQALTRRPRDADRGERL